MARSNYSYAKRQKELARKKKQEEKLQRKLGKTGGQAQGSENSRQDDLTGPEKTQDLHDAR